MAASGITVASAASGSEIAFDKYGDASPPTTDQRVQWIGVTAGTTGALAPVSGANPLPVRSGVVDLISVTLSLDTSAYASGDLLADAQAIAGAVRVSGGSAELVSIMVIDEDDQKQSIGLYVTSDSTSWGSENSAVAVSDAVARSIQAYVPIITTDYIDLGGVSIAQPRLAQNIGVICEASGSTSLYVVAVCNSGTPTYTASGVRVVFGFKQN